MFSFLAFWVGAEDKTVEQAPLFGLINHLVGLISVHCAVSVKKGSGDPSPVFAPAVLNVADVGFRQVAGGFAPFDVIGFENRHYFPVSPFPRLSSHSPSRSLNCGVLARILRLASFALSSTTGSWVFWSRP